LDFLMVSLRARQDLTICVRETSCRGGVEANEKLTFLAFFFAVNVGVVFTMVCHDTRQGFICCPRLA
jgi:hypothetical protein